MNKFKTEYGPWAVVTGATDGIGLAIAEELASLGIDLALIGRRPGFLSKFLGYSLLTLNRWGRILVMKKIMSGMAKR